MTRFIYIADTHLGANPMGYQQQKGFPDKLQEIVVALREQAESLGAIDFILHGGDMIDSTRDETIVAATKAFDLGLPVYLCLGNHDLTVPDSLERWLALAPQFFVDGSPNYRIETDDCIIHVAPNHWCNHPFYWNGDQRPHLSETQVASLHREIASNEKLPTILATHSPVFGLPVEQTGMAVPFHCPEDAFSRQITEIANSHEHLTCVLGAHNHMNMCIAQNGVEYLTASSLVETPFEFKLFEVTRECVRMSTVALGPALTFGCGYDDGKSYVSGRDCDRSFSKDL